MAADDRLLPPAPRLSARCLAALALAGAALAIGCGGDDDGSAERTPADRSTPATVPTETTPPRTETQSEGEETVGVPGQTSPEEQQGGAGDEVPARSLALITGRGGRLSPRLVQVPPYIAVRVELRSADGARYSLRGRGRSLEAGGDLSSVATTFAGLRPGRSLVLTGPQGRVTVEASAEPGP
jgi:hypothetical protein